jgi:hypothetical protein
MLWIKLVTCVCSVVVIEIISDRKKFFLSSVTFPCRINSEMDLIPKPNMLFGFALNKKSMKCLQHDPYLKRFSYKA